MKITQDNIQDVFKCTQAKKEYLLNIGYKLIKDCFVDNSGLSSETGLVNTFLEDLKAEVEKHKKVYCYITDVGQFQVYVSIFIK